MQNGRYDYLTVDKSGKQSIEFGVYGIPESILINKEGKEFGKVIGEIDFASEEFIKLLRKYI